MKKIDVKNLRAKERVACFIGDKLLHEPKPRKLEKVYNILAGVNDLETDPQLKEYLEQLSCRAQNTQDFAIDVLDMLLFISKSRKDVVSELIILAAVDILEAKVRSQLQEKKSHAEAPRKPLASLPKDAVPPPMPQISLNAQQEDIVVKEQEVHFKEDDKLEDRFRYEPNDKQQERSKKEAEAQRRQLAVMRINQRLEGKEKPFQPVYSSGDEGEEPAAQPKADDSSEEMNEKQDTQNGPGQKAEQKPRKEPGNQSDAQPDTNDAKSASEDSDDEAGEDEESQDGDEDGSGESFDAEAFYEQFKQYEHEGLGDLNDSYLHDVKDPKDRSFQKEYVFERTEEEPQYQAPPHFPNQKQNPAPRNPKATLVLKKRLSPQDKKKLDSLMARIQKARDGRELADLQMQVESIIYVDANAQDFVFQRLSKKPGFPKDKKKKGSKIADKKKKREEKKKLKKFEKVEQLKKLSQPNSATPKPNQPLPEFKKKDTPAQVKPIVKKPAQQKQKVVGNVFQNMKKWEKSDEEGAYPKFNQILSSTVYEQEGAPADAEPMPDLILDSEPPVAPPEQTHPQAKTLLSTDPEQAIPADDQPTPEQQPQPQTPKPVPAEERFLAISDLNPSFEYKYISGLSPDFRAAIEHLAAQKCIGFDTEFISVDNSPMATYLQFASTDKGYIFNLQTEDKYKTEFKELIEQVCSNKQLLKIGFNIKQDIPALTRVFNYDLECDGFVSLEERLFTNASATLGLSELCRRNYGYPMNKELQKVIAKQKELVDDEEIVYGVLDALVPLRLFLDLKKAIDSSPHDHLYFEDEFQPNDIEFLIDASCLALKPLIQRSDFYNEILFNLTYAEILEKTQSKKSILITCDKYIISNPAFKNKFVFYDMKSFKKEFYELTNTELA